ncbi:T9SS type A sorting domain-containing protein [Haliscomenobacter sp.]|uniref:T9SS type A sorting domain-containing protein n=1 Tax=Haliscomenobacter sp. TaxID=2717303 RepID=UPI003365256A
MAKMYPILLLFFSSLSLSAQTFTPSDILIATNVFQVEFSADSRSMVWCEQIPLSGARAKVWYTDMDLTTGLPDLARKQLIDTIQGQGWPYWGEDQTSPFFLIKNQRGEIIYVRRTGINTLSRFSLGKPGHPDKGLINVSADKSKPYFWVNYTVKTTVANGRDSLFCFSSDNPAKINFIASEVPSPAGSIYELTFPRWLAQSEILAHPFRTNPAQPYYDMKFWNGATLSSTVVTQDVQNSLFNSHVDDLPFRVPQKTGELFMFSSKGSRQMAIYQQQKNGLFSEIETYASPTSFSPLTLTSFEPFTINGNQTFGAYQVYQGGGIPGNTKGEIWLRGIFGQTLHTKISTFDGVTVDPEYVIGPKKVWIYYYGKAVGAPFFDLRRCETPLSIVTTRLNDAQKPQPIFSIYPNPARDFFTVQTAESVVPFELQLFDSIGRLIRSEKMLSNEHIVNLATLPTGLYFFKPLGFGTPQRVVKY